MTASKDRDEVFCFTHIQRAGGTTVEAILRRHFGIRHLVVTPCRGWVYQKRDLLFDLRVNPFARSLAGHWLRPFVEFDGFRLAWYTFLREPFSRYLSHYRYHVGKSWSRGDFEEWLRRPRQRNWQTRLLAGEPDVEAAKQILTSRFRCVGILERFRESLLLVRRFLGLDTLNVEYGRPRNAANSPVTQERIDDILSTYRDDIAENNRLDLELYDFVLEDLFPRQVQAYGEDRLQRDVINAFNSRDAGWPDLFRDKTNALFRVAVYLPASTLRSELARLRGIPEILH